MKLKADYLKRVIEELPDARSFKRPERFVHFPNPMLVTDFPFDQAYPPELDLLTFTINNFREWEIEIDASKPLAEELKAKLEDATIQKTILMYDHLQLKDKHMIIEKQFKSLRSKWFVKLYLWLHWKWFTVSSIFKS